MINFQDHYLKLHVYNPLIGHKTYQFSPKDSLSDLRNTVCQTTELMMYENFHFEKQNQVLSEFLEMGQALTSGTKINIIFNSFDQRSSKFHYNKIKNLLENPSILVNHNYSYDQTNVRKQIESIKTKLSQNIDQFLKSIQRQEVMQPKLLQFESRFSQWLNFSGYNPAPYYRKLMGDYYYIYFKSPQEIDHHITGHSQGFFLNQSTNSHFNPNISSKHSKIYISLLDLMYSISPKFKQLFKECLQKIKSNQYQKYLIGPLVNKKPEWMKDKKQILKQMNTWKINPLERATRRQQILTIKDWNEMFQIQHLQPSESFYQKVNREKLKFKIYQQFVDYAKAGAMSIIEKGVLPINPNSPKKQQSFLFTNIYFSFVDNSLEEKQFIEMSKSNQNNCFDLTKKQTKLTNNYILNLQLIDDLEGLDLHLSHSVLVQYKGQKLRAQSFPSSLIYTKAKNEQIEEMIQRKNILNSSLTSSKQPSPSNSPSTKEFDQSLMKLTFKLNLEYDNIVRLIYQQNKPAKKVTLSSEIRGVQTIDKRKYLFNLHSLMAKDYNFMASNNTSNAQSNSRFDFYVCRPELIALYNEKYRCRIPINSMLGKTLKGKFQLQMNEKLRTEEKKLKSIANFAKQQVLTMVITAFQGDMKRYLADTKNVVTLLHKYGLNCRYLGLVHKKIDKKKSPHLQIMIEKVIYVKVIKNIINSALKAVSYNNCRQLVAHLLNCVFYPEKVIKDEYNAWKCAKDEEIQQQNYQVLKKKKKKNKDKQKEQSLLTLNGQQNGQFFLTIEPQELNKIIRRTAKAKYNHDFDNQQQTKIFRPKIFSYFYGKSSMLRDICLNVGIVLQKKDYFSEKVQQSFHPFVLDNICSFQPRCTHTNPDKKQLQNLIAEGDHFLSQFFVEQSIQSYNKAIQYILTTFGGNNQKLPLIHKKLSFIYFKIGDIQTALLFGSHSLGMFEQFYGFEHVQTIDNLAMLGIYHCAQRNFPEAQQCLFRAIYYAYTAYGEIYPEILTLWLNLSTIYQIQKQFAEAIMCLFQGLKICIKLFGENHLNSSIYYAALSSLHLQIPDIMNAIKHKQKSLLILQKLLPQNDVRIKESTQMLEYLKSLQNSKKIKQIHEKQLRKLQNSAFGYHPSQLGAWQYNGRNGRNSSAMGNFMTYGHRTIGKMHQFFLRQSEQFWRKPGGRRLR